MTTMAIDSGVAPAEVRRQNLSPAMPSGQRSWTVGIIGAAFVALVLKLVIAYNTFGSNDVVTFYSFGRSLSDHGLEWTYRRGIVWLPVAPIFNHPPVTAYYLRFIDGLSRQEIFRANGFNFPFLIRLPGIIADFVVVLVLAAMSRRDGPLRCPAWALLLFALSPVSLMVSGFHGNTDPVMVMFLLLASLMCLHNRPLACGLFLALSCQIKIVPVLFFPILFLFWWHRRAIMSFLFPLALASVALWWEPLTKFPLLFAQNVLSYGSYWGIWGITYWLRLTGYSGFNWVSFMDFPPPQTVVVTFLKALIVVSILVIAWRRRVLDGRASINSIAYAWVIFFVFAPGICAQYMVWLAPFILIMSPSFYAWLTATSSLFLFFFYNITAHGLPWYMAISTSKLNTVWTPWSLWPWAALIIGGILLWRKAVVADPTLRLFSLKTLPARSRD
jgi:Gpi18-like mannosyltransferase